MNTHFASPERTSKKEWDHEIKSITKSEVIQGILHTVSGLLAIIDENRQILAVNDSFLNILGIEDEQQVLGLRPGEALNCVHAHDEDGGCGTSRYCSTCGAAVAIVTCLSQDKPVERRCFLEASKGGEVIDLPLLVKSHPIKIEGKSYVLLFIRDITTEQQRAVLERTFFHDINNMIFGLVGASEELSQNYSDRDLAKRIHEVSLRLSKEMELQRNLLKNGTFSYEPTLYKTKDDTVLEEVEAVYISHPLVEKRSLEVIRPHVPQEFCTDISLILRVICNMVTNALEASFEGETVKLWSEKSSEVISFHVWNNKLIEKDIALRVFQRNFSTKGEDGRGLGTYSMKLLGENILRGKVSFSTSKEKGTVFKILLPLQDQG